VRVLVTGSGGHLARAVLPRLLADPRVERVIGVDWVPSGLTHPRLAEHALDMRSPRLGELAAGCDALVHLAFVVVPGVLGRRWRDRALMRAINVDGSRHVFQVARDRGVGTLVHLSSVAAYGTRPHGPQALTEAAQRRPDPAFGYALDKAEVEDLLDRFEAHAPGPRLVRLRPHAIVGPNALPLIRSLLRLPLYLRLPDPQPLYQCVHEDDVAHAVLLALHGRAGGAFNLAAEPAASLRTLQRRRHRISVALPLALARASSRLLWRFTGAGGEPGWLESMRHPLVVDCARTREVLGWRPRHDLWSALASLDGTRDGGAGA
jgi:UDP-glucose 4-epimerase